MCCVQWQKLIPHPQHLAHKFFMSDLQKGKMLETKTRSESATCELPGGEISSFPGASAISFLHLVTVDRHI
jgi:hypothetical protein